MKKVLSKSILLIVLLSMFSQSFLSGLVNVSANQTYDLGLVANINSTGDGVLSNKTALLADNQGVTVTYQLAPKYTESFVSGTRIYLHLPSFNAVDDQFSQVGKNDAPGSMGVRGQVVNIDESWHVVNGEIQDGGWLEVEYVGNLRAGDNPSFQVRYTTYGDTLPEGLKLDLYGFVSYVSYNDQENTNWSTPSNRDSDSDITLISTNLKWDAHMSVPKGDNSVIDIWDRYNYVDYIYEIENESVNVNANIDGYHVSLEMDSQSIDKNGVLNYDINKWKYNPDGNPILNDDLMNTKGDFVGVKDKGGVLIYDITDVKDLSKVDELAEPIPYSYSGGGSINFDQSKGSNRKMISPEGVSEHHKRRYLISVPLAKQGFPNLPVNFKISAITNVVFAGDTNWSKTTMIERQVVAPKYVANFEATSNTQKVVYGGSTYFETKNIKNNSSVSIWDTSLDYKIDDGLMMEKIELRLPQGHSFDDYTNQKIIFGNKGDLNIKGVFSEDEEYSYLTFPITQLNNSSWDRTFSIVLMDEIESHTTLPLNVKVYGQPVKVTNLNLATTLNYFEKFAINEDLSEAPVYESVSYNVKKNTVVEVNQLVPSVSIGINSNSDSPIVGGKYTQSVKLAGNVNINYFFGIKEAIAPNSEFSTIINTVGSIGINDVSIRVHANYLNIATNPEMIIEYIDGTSETINLSDQSVDSDYVYKTEKDVASVTLTSEDFENSTNKKNLTISGVAKKGNSSSHGFSSYFRVFQDSPYEFNRRVNALGQLNISLPVPAHSLRINSSEVNTIGSVNFNRRAYIDYLFGTNNIMTPTARMTSVINQQNANGIYDAKLTINNNLKNHAENIKLYVLYLDGTEEIYDIDFNEDENYIVDLGDDVNQISLVMDNFITTKQEDFMKLEGIVNRKKVSTHNFTSSFATTKDTPSSNQISRVSGRFNITLPRVLSPETNVVSKYGNATFEDRTNIAYESTFDVDFQVNTGNVTSPNSTYSVDLLKPTLKGKLNLQRIKLSDVLLSSTANVVVKLKYSDKTETTINISESDSVITNEDNILDDVATVEIISTNIRLSKLETIMTATFYSTLDQNGKQSISGKFTGNQNMPYVDNVDTKVVSKSHEFAVFRTQTTSSLRGVNQADKNLGAGQAFTNIIPATRNGSVDNTLDQGYKTLGGYTSSISRPSVNYANNNQTVTLNTEFPTDVFDMYYIKIEDRLKPFIKEVKIYRKEDNKETLWQSLTNEDWQYNTLENKYWRINSAYKDNAGDSLYETYDSENVDNHPYYKNPWSSDINPESPVSRVEVVLEFKRNSNAAVPQLAGASYDVIQYMGRFYESSKNRDTTKTVTTDKTGLETVVTSTYQHSISTLVNAPAAQTSTGAHDNTSLNQKSLIIGTVGEYKTSLFNMVQISTSNGSHGPNTLVPVRTEYDEWLHGKRIESFHDELTYQFVFPQNPNQNKDYNYNPKYFNIENTSTLKYMKEVVITFENREELLIELDKNIKSRISFNFVNEEVGTYEILDNHVINIGIGEEKKTYPKDIAVTLEEIPGFGDNTAEISGVKKDSLGSSLNEVDFVIGGIVNGDKNLTGISYVFRNYNTKDKTQVASNSAVLTGITPTLSGRFDMRFDNNKVYDYKADGITPNSTNVYLGFLNHGEADAKQVDFDFTPNANFRSKTVSIPKEIFDGDLWYADTAVVDNKDVKQYFELVGDMYILDLAKLFEEGILKRVAITKGDSHLNKDDVRSIKVSFKPHKESTVLYGTFSKQEANDNTLPSRLMVGDNLIINGTWVDEDSDGSNWNSVPTFVSANTKASHEVMTAYSSFNIKGQVHSYLDIYKPGTTGNNGEKPTYTLNNNNAPQLYNRVAKSEFSGQHLSNDLILSDDNKLFYDSESKKQVSMSNINVGDTAKVLYKFTNNGTLGTSDRGVGHIPVFSPEFRFETPVGLKINTIIPVDDSNLTENLKQSINDESFKPIKEGTYEIDDKLSSLVVDGVLDFDESYYVIVEYEAVNNLNDNEFAMQNRTTVWNSYAKPSNKRNFMSYDTSSSSGFYTVGPAGNTVKDTLYYSRVYNQAYRYSNPNILNIESSFHTENITGNEAIISVSNIQNTINHDNSHIELFITLDTIRENNRSSIGGGYHLSEFPTPQYPEGIKGEFESPHVYFMYKGYWVLSSDFDDEIHSMQDIIQLKVDYGIVHDAEDNTVWKAPDFDIKGIVSWDNTGTFSTKYYDFNSTARIEFTRYNGDVVTDKYKYETRTPSALRVWKAIARVHLNLQSFDTLAEALDKYSAGQVGKTSYKPGEDIFYKLALQNINSNQGVNTTSAHGKAALLNPKIVDKIPEYLHTDLVKYYDENTETIDIQKAVDDGIIHINWFDINNELVTDFKLPNVSAHYVSGLDVGGDQTFNPGTLKNNGDGVLSTAQPSSTGVNPAATIEFFTITYDFEQDLDRGERIEIVYKSTTRSDDLPYAKYPDGRPVFAPFLGWYGNSNPVSTHNKDITMDMASLLHDVGVSGQRTAEVSSAEFLMNSYSYLPGSQAGRDLIVQNNQSTFYDSSANKERVSTAVLKETSNNTLYTSSNSTTTNDYYSYLLRSRVNDGKVKSDERILWAQDGIQLSRAWLYGASELFPRAKRPSSGTSSANFYEHDGSLNHVNIARSLITPYHYDNHTYAVELNEIFTARLHGVNMGDRAIESGLEYLEILPHGISPFDSEGDLLGVNVYQGLPNSSNTVEIDKDLYTVEIIQSPDNDQGYRAPKQSREGQTTAKTVYEEHVPYVLRIRVKSVVTPWFKHINETSVDTKYQFVDLKVRVEEEIINGTNIGVNRDLSVWYDHLTVSTLQSEEYLAVYDTNYGKFNRGPSSNYGNGARYPRNGISAGIELRDSSVGTTDGNNAGNVSFEPYGMYIRGLNATGTAVDLEDGRLGISTGDQIAMRKPTLRVWSNPEKIDKVDSRYRYSIDDFNVNPYDELYIHGTVENQQLETTSEYNRTSSGYNRYTGDDLNDDVWINTPQTIGGARGSWFEPTLTFKLPQGIVPVLENGDYARYYNDVSEYQNIEFTASINRVTHKTSVLKEDVTEYYDVEVKHVVDGEKQNYVLYFTLKEEYKDKVKVAYGESLVITPRVKIVDISITNGLYDDIEIFANSTRKVFNPIISNLYTTGSLPSVSARDNGNITSRVDGLKITAHDRTRRDSMTTWSSNVGAMRITNRLITATAKTNNDMMINGEEYTSDLHYGATGRLKLKLKKPSLENTTKIMSDLSDPYRDHVTLDVAGNYWTSTNIQNKALMNVNKHLEAHSAGDILHSRLLFTYYISDFVEVLDDVRIKIKNQIYTREEFEALGYTVERITPDNTTADKGRQRVQFIITPPKGRLDTTENIEFLFRSLFTDGFNPSQIDNAKTWKDDSFRIDSYVSVITDDDSLNDAIHELDFITQDVNWINYTTRATDANKGHDVNDDGDLSSIYAYDFTTYEILQPKGEIRKNNLKPREVFSNGQVGDAYFNSSETVDYMITYAKNTGSGVKKFIVEDIVPTYETLETSINTSESDLSVRVTYLTSGNWELPKSMTDKLERDGKTVDEIFKLSMYISTESAVDGYEDMDESWILINPEGNSIYDNEKFIISDLELGLEKDIKKVRWVIESLDTENYLVPQGTRLDVDANPNTQVKEEVIATDPNNLSSTVYPDTVVDNAARVGLRALSDSNITLFIYNNAQLWTNYVDEHHHKYDSSETRSYLTPSRPIVNVLYSSQYFTREAGTTGQYHWDTSQIINYNISRHLKFTGEFVNADETMWDEDESVIYSEDTLINPNVTFMLPQAVLIKPEQFKHVSYNEIDETHPLSDEHTRQGPLSDNLDNVWTWHVLDPEGEVVDDHELRVKKAYTGPWKTSPQNTINIEFEGVLDPGYSVIVEFIGEVNEYNPSTSESDFRSKAMVLNNTGLLKPLNSRSNSSNILGYQLDEHDFNDNGVQNDRIVFSERSLFEYATFENFGKRKTSFSGLNNAGTKDPYATPTSEGSNYRYEVKVENPGATSKFYPVIYDILPHLEDREILKDQPRNSKFSGWLNPESVELLLVGDKGRKLTASDYDIWVGPFVRVDGKFDITMLPPQEEVSNEQFYFDLLDKDYRDQYFVKLEEVAEIPFLLQFVTAIAVTYKNPNFELPPKHNLVLNYEMEAPINSPVLFETSDTSLEDISEFANWNTFVTMQKLVGQAPQESNRAGVYVTQQHDKVSLGNYIWNDKNYDGLMNEGNYVRDENGRLLNYDQIDLDGDGWPDDPGIDGVKVTLKSEKGYNVDHLGNVIVKEGSSWYVINESTLNFALDEFGNKIRSKGPVETYSKYDIYGYSGYYVLSNITPGNYRLEYEFSEDYDHFGLTSHTNMANVTLNPFEIGEELPYLNRKAERLTVVSDTFTISLKDSDDFAMSFDLGAASTSIVKGNVFMENKSSLDGLNQKNEKGILGYNVYLEDIEGVQAYSTNGKKLHTVTDKDGNYEFSGVPLNHEYRIRVTNENDEVSTSNIVSPFNHYVDPRFEMGDNDGYKNHENINISNNFKTDVRINDGVYSDLDQLIIDNIDFGYYERDEFGIIGNKVWLDQNKNGIQDLDEPGVGDVKLQLTQYAQNEDGVFKRTSKDPMTTVSNKDGYYYFRDLPVYNNKKVATLSLDTMMTLNNAQDDSLFGYYLEIVSLPKGYTVTTAKAEEDDISNNDIFDNDFNVGMITDFEELITLKDLNDIGLAINNLDLDLGLVKHGKGSISGGVWADNNGDGIKDADEPLLDNYTFSLEVLNDDDWEPVYIDEDLEMINPNDVDRADNKEYVLTGSEYHFDKLYLVDIETEIEYTYRVLVDGISLKFKITKSGVSSDDEEIELDNIYSEVSREDKISVISEEIVLFDEEVETTNGTNALFIDHDNEEAHLGLIPLADYQEIGGVIFNDENKNNKHDENELGLEDVEISLYELNSEDEWELVVDDHDEIYTVSTDETGQYRFVVPVANEHDEIISYMATINRDEHFELNNQELFTDYVNIDITLDDIDEAHTIVSNIMTLVNEDDNGRADYERSSSQLSHDVAFSVYENIRTIGSTVFNDVNDNGKYDESESGIEGLTVNIFKQNLDNKEWELLDSVETDENGEYEFEVDAVQLVRSEAYYRSINRYKVNVVYDYNMVLNATEEDEYDFHNSELLDENMQNYVSEEIILIDEIVESNAIDLNTLKDDLDNHVGLVVYETEVKISSKITTGKDTFFKKAEGVSNVIVRLEKYNKETETWELHNDLNNVNTIVTEADGKYEFSVEPTNFDSTSEEFMEQYQYRLSITKPVESVFHDDNESLVEFNGYHDAITVIADVYTPFEVEISMLDLDDNDDLDLENKDQEDQDVEEVDPEDVEDEDLEETEPEDVEDGDVDETDPEDVEDGDVDETDPEDTEDEDLTEDDNNHTVLLLKESLQSIRNDEDISISLSMYELQSSITGKVFTDPDYQGLNIKKKKGISDVPVDLYQIDEDGEETLITSTTTDSDGNYEFTVVPFDKESMSPNNYVVRIEDVEYGTISTDTMISINLYEQDDDIYAYMSESLNNDFGIYVYPDYEWPTPDKDKPITDDKVDSEDTTEIEDSLPKDDKPSSSDIESSKDKKESKDVNSGIKNNTQTFVTLTIVASALMVILRKLPRRKRGEID